MPTIELVKGLPLTTGWRTDLDDATYRGLDRLNPSALAAGLMGVREIDPAAIKASFEGDGKARSQQSQDRMDRGTLAHLALLQPELLPDRVAVWRGGRRQGAEWDAFEDEHSDRIIMRHDDYTATMAVVNRLRSLKLAAELLRDMTPEVAILSTANIDGLTLATKGRVDAVNIAQRTIVDIKTTEAGIDERSVENTIRGFHYREKMACYRDWFAAETKTDPEDWRVWLLFFGLGDHVGVRAVKLTTGALEFGRFRMQAALQSVAQCLQTGTWPTFEVSGVMDVAMWECPEEGEVDIDYQ